ncbi:sugar ABC transporter ATP-binding protein [Tabrizicola sp. BL-A-41-H6]|uniref:sugar ABC transporter ATP-binding protein n=1 Tax=Tabrizicola sp. BL-A-41-H6 TaxID=3421107 RepID=UPI003D67EBCC
MRHLLLTGVAKAYGPTLALRGVSLALRGGEVHALMGENGAGKSTLIRVLAGLERADAGEVVLDGAPLRLTGPEVATAAGFRFLHQEMQVVPGLSVAENMHLAHRIPQRWGLVDWGRMRAAAAAALAELGIAEIDPRATMADLGPGDRMLARIAATLIADGGPEPWLYVLDEPTAALSHAEAERLFAVIGRLVGRGAAVLYVSHRMDEVMRLADRVTVLRDGVTASVLDRAAMDRDRIIRDMTGRAVDALFPPRAARVGRVLLEADGLAGGSLALRAGEVVGLAGLAGAGRNALLKTLIGALPRAGKVRLDGVEVPPGPTAAWAAGIAYVPRDRRSEGVMLGQGLGRSVSLPHLGWLARAGILRHRAEARLVADSGAAVRLKAEGPGQAVAELSGGNQQKVLFARALAGKPRVLLLDEPTRGVDVGAKADIYALVRRMAEGGAAVAVASSDLAELIGLCDRIVLVRDGRPGRDLAAEGLSEAALLAAIYDGEAA